MRKVGLRGCMALVAITGLVAVPCSDANPGALSAGALRAKAVRAYWTPQRMRAAIPLGGSGAATTAAKAPLHRRVRHIAKAPLRTHGKVFFSVTSLVARYDYQCSGTAVRAPSRSLVITAGHCSYDQATLHLGGNAVRNWVFVPAYSDGHAPFGKWPGQTTATQQWRNSSPTITPTGDIAGGDLRFDVGAGTVGRLHGKSLQSVVGGRQIAFNKSRNRTYHAFGYPAENPFDGRTEFACDSPLTGSDGSSGQPADLGIRCDMTGGASGGGWVDGKGELVSVTSYSRGGDPNTLYGPYFGNEIQAFYNSVKNG